MTGRGWLIGLGTAVLMAVLTAMLQYVSANPPPAAWAGIAAALGAVVGGRWLPR